MGFQYYLPGAVKYIGCSSSDLI